MESTLNFKLDDILRKSVLYKVNKNDYTLKKLNLSENEHYPENSEEITINIAFPHSEDQYKNVSSGNYEGGYTVWESTWVLLSFLENLEVNETLSVLELGAGIGICGTLLSLKKHKVTFQDLNLSVIKKGLIPNLLFNHIILEKKNKDKEANVDLIELYKDEIKNVYQFKTDSVKLKEKKINFEFDFLIGDWNHLISTEQIYNNLKSKFTIIIASECIYRIENYSSITKIIHTFMNNNGKAYIATKRFYFGLSGGTFQFLEFITNDKEIGNEFKLYAKIIKSVEPKNSSNVIDIIEVSKLPFEN